MLKRVIIPDSHGCYADHKALVAAVNIIKKVRPNEVVFLGDHVDCSGLFSRFPGHYEEDTAYSIEDDFAEARHFIEEVRNAAPRADIHYLEGNHEQHVERWAVSDLKDSKEIRTYLEKLGVPARLQLSKLRVRYVRRSAVNAGCTTPGFLPLEGCLFTHGSSTAKHATHLLVTSFATSVVHGHTHRAVHVTARRPDGTITHGACPGTLAKLHMTYLHTNVSQWSHGVAYQEVVDGKLWHMNIHINEGRYALI